MLVALFPPLPLPIKRAEPGPVFLAVYGWLCEEIVGVLNDLLPVLTEILPAWLTVFAPPVEARVLVPDLPTTTSSCKFGNPNVVDPSPDP